MAKTIATLSAAIFFWSHTVSFVQNKIIPLNISIFNEATAIPFTKFVTAHVFHIKQAPKFEKKYLVKAPPAQA